MYFLVQIINWIYWLLIILLLARVILSWVRPDPYHPVWGPLMRITYQVTEPLLAPIRRLMPATSGIDLSPMILWFGLSILHRLLLSIVI